MKIELGIKSDPIEYRYSFEWLFRLMEELNVPLLQLGSFMELYSVDPSYLHDLREAAEAHGIEIRSCFTAHRELGGFLTGDPRLEQVAMDNYRRWIDVAAAVGARYCGSNPGAVYRDRMNTKGQAVERYLSMMPELMRYAQDRGLSGLLIEPMSCSAEPPTFPGEIQGMMESLQGVHHDDPDSTAPVYLCSDMTHGVADRNGEVLHDALELFADQAPYMAEFHFKNTDARFDATFGFESGTDSSGIIDLAEVRELIVNRRDQFPVTGLAGYLELPGPKRGREYSDILLEDQLRNSIREIQRSFAEVLVSP